ncbi:MAG: VWA domain-containing protein [Clostridia bacterium]|nr:VWA domain-containing protein [Clostridia bacterium]
MIAKYNLKRALIFVMVLILTVGVMPLTVMAATYTDEIEIETRTIILVDRSGSMKDREAVDKIMASLDTENVTIAYFDSHKLTLDENYNVGGNSSICEAIDAAARGGFVHIIVVTDGEQYPREYGALGIYTDLDVQIFLSEEKDKEAEKFLAELQDSLVNSSLTVTGIDGNVEVLMDGYKPKTYTVQIEVPDPVIEEPESDDEKDPGDDDESDPGPGVLQIVNCNHECVHKCKWWCWLALPIAILALLLALLRWLLGLRGGWFTPVKRKIKNGAVVLLDVSGSMRRFIDAVIRAARKAKATIIIAFGSEVVEAKLDEVAGLDIGGSTRGTEALKKAAANGYEEIILVSDLMFNGEAFVPSDFSHKFKCITVLAPNPYNMAMVSELQQIADRVEVLSL